MGSHEQPSSTGEPFQVAIIGGGICGLYAALSLHYHSQIASSIPISITVYEQAPEYREIGAGIGIGINAAKLLHKIGIYDKAAAIAARRKEGLWLSFRRYDNDGVIVDVPMAGETSEVVSLSVARSEFLDVLKDAIVERGAAKLETNKKCEKVWEEGDKVKVQFQDGTTATADLLIGGDGIHSAVRSHFAEDKPQFSGRVAYRALVPVDQLPSDWTDDIFVADWLSKGNQFLTFPISRNKTLNIVAFVQTPPEKVGNLQESWTSVADRSECEEDFKEFSSVVQKIISLMPAKPSKWALHDRIPLDQWVFLGGKVALAGDACHAMLPHQSAGGGQAIEDGYILGKVVQGYLSQRQSQDVEKEKAKSLERWLKLYQDVRLPRAQRIQRSSRETGAIYEMSNDEMKDKSYDECCKILHDKMQNRMNAIWTEDVDDAYYRAEKEMIGNA
ncbi:hypothetical protein F5884DRAFT_748635 [Xylogone sp. PMI_703]|nr:hypothetical protein F5884DRAFT_748635 [Xylogone sp. PMI_703]